MTGSGEPTRALDPALTGEEDDAYAALVGQTTTWAEWGPFLAPQHETAHVVIVDERSGDPLGVVSTLDVALALAGLAPNPVAGS